MSKITPFLWFQSEAEEAANFYVSLFPDSRLGRVTRFGPGAPGPEGSVLTAEFVLSGQPFIALNGGPKSNFTEAVSFSIDCKDQEEVDYYWNALTANGGKESQCGWLKDRYGLSWQVVPRALGQYLSVPDPVKAKRVMGAMLKMKKIVVAELDAAYAGD